MNDMDLYWLCGLLEGEGSFLAGTPSNPNRTRVHVQMTDRDVIERVARLWVSTVAVRPPQVSHHKESYVTSISCRRARDFMVLAHPLMGERRQAQIDRALAAHDPRLARRARKLSEEQVDELRRRHALGESGQKIAEEFGVSGTVVYRILRGEAYREKYLDT